MKIGGIYIELLSNCNLRCKHCYNSSGERKHVLDFSTLENVANYVKDQNIKGVSLSGGEPFLHPNIIEIINLFISAKAQQISIVTNGTALSEEVLIRLKDVFDKISFQISLDGASPKQHDFVRGDGAFDKLIQGINLLQKYRAKYFFHCVIHKGNYLNVDEIINFANRQNKTRVDFALLKKKGRGIDNYDDIALDIQSQINLIMQLNERKQTYNINAPAVFYGSCPIFNDADAETFIRIDCEGNVYPCQNFSYQGSSLGNILFESLDEITSTWRINNLYGNIKKFRSSYSKCSTCAIKSYCNLGCPGVEYCEEFKNDLSNDCLLRKEYFKRLLLESGAQNYVKTQ